MRPEHLCRGDRRLCIGCLSQAFPAMLFKSHAVARIPSPSIPIQKRRNSRGSSSCRRQLCSFFVNVSSSAFSMQILCSLELLRSLRITKSSCLFQLTSFSADWAHSLLAHLPTLLPSLTLRPLHTHPDVVGTFLGLWQGCDSRAYRPGFACARRSMGVERGTGPSSLPWRPVEDHLVFTNHMHKKQNRAILIQCYGES